MPWQQALLLAFCCGAGVVLFRTHASAGSTAIPPPNLTTATVSTSNLGGLCGLSCKTDQSNYNTATGVCAYTDTSNPKCDQGAAHEMYFRGLGTTQSGSQVDLRVTNLTEYIPWDSNQNGLSGAWGQISLLANHPTEFLFEFIDTVHARYYLLTPHSPLPRHRARYCPPVPPTSSQLSLHHP